MKYNIAKRIIIILKYLLYISDKHQHTKSSFSAKYLWILKDICS